MRFSDGYFPKQPKNSAEVLVKACFCLFVFLVCFVLFCFIFVFVFVCLFVWLVVFCSLLPKSIYFVDKII